MQYTIRFENVTNASASARRVQITNRLEAGLDIRAVRLLEIGFGSYKVSIPENRSFFQARVPLGTDFNNLWADITAGVDIQKGQVRWTITAIDPTTGESPESALSGLLPPNNTNHVGEGYVIYTVKPRANTPTGTIITNQAGIIFDTNEPIETNPWLNTIDGAPPTSTVSKLSSTTEPPSFPVSWSGIEDVGGSGLKDFDIYVSDNETGYQVWLANTTNVTAVYEGLPGHTYAFYSIARDNAGNVELAPSKPDAETSVLGNNAPVLLPLPDQFAFVGDTLTVTNTATDVDRPVQRLTFSLDPGAPVGASLNATNGIFRWTPRPEQAGKTNQITVRVTDDGTPRLSATQTFRIVVTDFVESGLGEAIVRDGSFGNVPIRLVSSVPLRSVCFTLEYPSNLLKSVSISNLLAGNTKASITSISATQSVICLSNVPSLTATSTQVLARLNFSTVSNQMSAFVPIQVSDATAVTTKGTVITKTSPQDGRIVLIGKQPLLEALISSNRTRVLKVYGPANQRYLIESALGLSSAPTWRVFQTVDVGSELVKAITVPSASATVLYRARELGSMPLNIEQVGDRILIEWSSDCTGCILEESEALGTDAFWSLSAAQPLSRNGRYQVMIQSPKGDRFYRLRLP